MQLLDDGDRLRVVAPIRDVSPTQVSRLSRSKSRLYSTPIDMVKSIPDDNPNIIPFSCIAVSSQSY